MLLHEYLRVNLSAHFWQFHVYSRNIYVKIKEYVTRIVYTSQANHLSSFDIVGEFVFIIGLGIRKFSVEWTESRKINGQNVDVNDRIMHEVYLPNSAGAIHSVLSLSSSAPVSLQILINNLFILFIYYKCTRFYN